MAYYRINYIKGMKVRNYIENSAEADAIRVGLLLAGIFGERRSGATLSLDEDERFNNVFGLCEDIIILKRWVS